MNQTQASKEHFDEIAKNYNKSYDGIFVGPMYKGLMSRMEELPKKPDSILDLGCGNGNILELLAKKGNMKLSGVDLSDKMIEEAAGRLGSRAVLKAGNAEAIPFEDDSFDLVICNASFHHYVNPEKVLSEIKRVLKKDGVFLLGDPTAPGLYLKFLNWALQYSKNGDYHVYSKKEICSLMEQNGFKIQNFERNTLKSFLLTAAVS